MHPSFLFFLSFLSFLSFVFSQVGVRMREQAGDVLMESLPWRAVLHLRDKPIEARGAMIRVVPQVERSKVEK